jgi:uncharacterized protein YlxP (DUF503 family)
MTIGVLHLDFMVPGAASLKDKRRVIKSIIAQMRGRFNCAVAETGYNDLWQRARLTACVVSNESRHANTMLNEIAKFASVHASALLVNYEIEML